MKKIDLGLPDKLELFHRSSHIEIVGSGLESSEQALYIEQEIEKYLH